MKHLLILSETLRRAKITTFYRASLCAALVERPGITAPTLARILQVTPNSVCVAMRQLEKLNLSRRESKSDGLAYYPTSYLKDLISNIDMDLKSYYINKHETETT